MLQNGVVTAVSGSTATVSFERSEACAKCHACDFGRHEQMDVELANTFGALVGDTVAVELHGGKLVKASMLAYIFPLALFIAGLMIAPKLHSALGLALDSDVFSCIVALALLGAALLVIRLTEKERGARGEFAPQMAGIVSRGAQTALTGEQLSNDQLPKGE